MPDHFYRRKNGLPGRHEIQKRRWRIQADLEGVQAAERVRLAAVFDEAGNPGAPRLRPGFLKGNLAAAPPHAARFGFPMEKPRDRSRLFSDGLSSCDGVVTRPLSEIFLKHPFPKNRHMQKRRTHRDYPRSHPPAHTSTSITCQGNAWGPKDPSKRSI